MAEQRVDITHEFDIPVGTLFRYLAHHENLAPLFKPIRVTRLADGTPPPDGLGSARRMSPPGLPSFVETITAFQPDRHIEYRITQGSPLKDHRGVMDFSPLGSDRSRLHYVITFEGKLPLVGPIVRASLDRGIRRALAAMRPA